MIRSCANCLVLAAAFQVIFGSLPDNQPKKIPRELSDIGIHHPIQQLIPRHCWHPPADANIPKCCPRPHLYTEEVLDICNIKALRKEDLQKPINKKPCEDGICLMKHSNLLFANGSIDYDKLGDYVDEWAASNPDFSEAILKAKPICAREKDESWQRGEPPDICDHDRVFVCFRSRILWDCKIKDIEECDSLRDNLEDCREYYENPRKRRDEDSRI